MIPSPRVMSYSAMSPLPPWLHTLPTAWRHAPWRHPPPRVTSCLSPRSTPLPRTPLGAPGLELSFIPYFGPRVSTRDLGLRRAYSALGYSEPHQRYRDRKIFAERTRLLDTPNRIRDTGIEKSPPSVLGSWILRTVPETPGSRVLDLRCTLIVSTPKSRATLNFTNDAGVACVAMRYATRTKLYEHITERERGNHTSVTVRYATRTKLYERISERERGNRISVLHRKSVAFARLRRHQRFVHTVSESG